MSFYSLPLPVLPSCFLMACINMVVSPYLLHHSATGEWTTGYHLCLWCGMQLYQWIVASTCIQYYNNCFPVTEMVLLAIGLENFIYLSGQWPFFPCNPQQRILIKCYHLGQLTCMPEFLMRLSTFFFPCETYSVILIPCLGVWKHYWMLVLFYFNVVESDATDEYIFWKRQCL